MFPGTSYLVYKGFLGIEVSYTCQIGQMLFGRIINHGDWIALSLVTDLVLDKPETSISDDKK